MATKTLLQLRTAVRQRCEQENSLFVTDAELNDYINASRQEYYDLMVQKYGDDYFVATPSTFVTNGTSERYPLPTDFQKLLGVDCTVTTSPSSYVSLKQFNFAERNRYSDRGWPVLNGVANLRYRLNGSNLWFSPIPQAGQTIRIQYIPQLADLVADADASDNIGGWMSEYVIIDACIKVLAKEESDVSVFGAQKMAIIARIEAAAENRDAGSPQTVSDVQSDDGWDDSSGWGY